MGIFLIILGVWLINVGCCIYILNLNKKSRGFLYGGEIAMLSVISFTPAPIFILLAEFLLTVIGEKKFLEKE